ncbi:MAG: helix-turn-helix transcriptional regulator [Clostridia bacterium]|nr:helix-turn-helix transcriptional regulator [Clostridia bacterium]
MTFNEMLIKRRKEVGQTQDDLADKLGVSRQSVSKWENGECMPDSEKLIKLSDVLDISLDELTGRTERTSAAAAQPAPAPASRISKRAQTIIAAAVCLVFGAACFLAGRYLFPFKKGASSEHASARTTEAPSEKPTEAPSAAPTNTPVPSPTPEPTPEPRRLDCPSKEELNPHDCSTVLAWLEHESMLNEKSNGEWLNPDFDQDDPATWFYEAEGRIFPVATWDEEGYLSQFVLYDGGGCFGNIDLSGCERLDYVYIHGYYSMNHIDLTGCRLATGVSLIETGIDSISPEPIVAPQLVIFESHFKHLHWRQALPLNEEQYSSGLEVILDADGGGTVGITGYMDTDYYVMYLCAHSDDYLDFKFVGWYDADGNLVSTEEQLLLNKLDMFDDPAFPSGTLVLTARFEPM